MLESLEPDRGIEIRVDSLVRDAVGVASHVGGECRTVTPTTHHHDLTLVAVALPDLKVDKPVRVVDELRPATERGDQLRSTSRFDS